MERSTVEKFKKKLTRSEKSDSVRQNKRERRNRRIKRAIKEGELYQSDSVGQ